MKRSRFTRERIIGMLEAHQASASAFDCQATG